MVECLSSQRLARVNDTQRGTMCHRSHYNISFESSQMYIFMCIKCIWMYSSARHSFVMTVPPRTIDTTNTHKKTHRHICLHLPPNPNTLINPKRSIRRVYVQSIGNFTMYIIALSPIACIILWCPLVQLIEIFEERACSLLVRHGGGGLALGTCCVSYCTPAGHYMRVCVTCWWNAVLYRNYYWLHAQRTESESAHTDNVPEARWTTTFSN